MTNFLSCSLSSLSLSLQLIFISDLLEILKHSLQDFKKVRNKSSPGRLPFRLLARSIGVTSPALKSHVINHFRTISLFSIIENITMKNDMIKTPRLQTTLLWLCGVDGVLFERVFSYRYSYLLQDILNIMKRSLERNTFIFTLQIEFMFVNLFFAGHSYCQLLYITKHLKIIRRHSSQDFLQIRNHSIPNFKKILKKCFFDTVYIMTSDT